MEIGEYFIVVPGMSFRPSIMQDFLGFKNGPFLPMLFVTSFLNFLVRV